MSNQPTQPIMALDVGEARIGVAASDALLITVSPRVILYRKQGNVVERIISLARELGANTIVIGLPYNMNGTLGMQARKVQGFASRLAEAAPTLELVFWDERLSSEEAAEVLIETGASRKRRQQPCDDIAAAVILRSYLDNVKRS